MKKSLLFSLLMLPLSLLFAQGSLQLFDHQGNQITNGQKIFVFVEDPTNWETVSEEYFIKNNSDHDIDMKCVRNVIEEVPETMNYFCALGVCLAPSIDETDAYTVAANTQVGEDNPFSAHYSPNGLLGKTKVSYKFYDVNNVNDSILFTITFNTDEMVSNSMRLYTTEGVEIVNGQLLEVPVEDFNAEYQSPDLLVGNVSASNMTVRVKRTRLNEVEGSVNYYCALGVCLSPTVDELTRDFDLGAGVTVDEENAFYSHYSPMGNQGKTELKFEFFDKNNDFDTIAFYVTFDGSTGIHDIQSSADLKAYPNPATNFVQISIGTSIEENANLVIYNMAGHKVYELPVRQQNELNLDLSEMPRGVYIYRIESEKINSAAYRLILQ